ncbi:MAG TPA: PfkB family carbohydrate kinase [Halobacteriales archaeon]|nr:PfkB family carbohydrate kinase [Halobacteriales archaeon]
MRAVVSLGSVNVDHAVRLDDATLAELRARYDWFPAAGETVTVESVPDDVRDFQWQRSLGGKGANQAVAAARAGADSRLLGAVGDDHREYAVLDSLASDGVTVDDVSIAEGPTGAAFVFLDEAAENRIVVQPGANAAVDTAYVRRHRETVRAADVFLLQNEVPVEPVEALLGWLDGVPDRPTVVLDPAPAAGAAPLLAHESVDLVTPNAVEAAALGDAVDRFEGTVVEKRGPDPVVVTREEADGGGFTISPPTVGVRDTTGAGDVFAGFLAARLAAGDGLREAVTVATHAASLSVREDGVQEATPTLAVVREWLDGR